jgi:hypothetical protein
MDIIRTHRKDHLNTLEKYHIYSISKDNVQMNNTNIDTPYILGINTTDITKTPTMNNRGG